MDVDGDEDEDVGVLPDGQPRRVYGEIDGQAVQGAAAVQTFANMQSEHMELTVESAATRERQEALLRDFEGRRRARSLAVPTADPAVRAMLRARGEPVTLFGEREMERRDRLRALLARETEEGGEPAVVGGQQQPQEVLVDVAPVAELFYTEGGEELHAARLRIAHSSLKAAAARLGDARERQRAGLPSASRAFGEAAPRLLASMATESSQLGDERPLSDVAISPDGSLLLTGSWSGGVAVWRNLTRGCDRALFVRAHEERVSGVAWHPQAGGGGPSTVAFATAACDKTARLWSADGTLLHTLVGHADRLGRCRWHPGGAYLATAGYDATWRLWDAGTGSQLLVQEGHARAVYALAFQPDGSLALSAGLDGFARVWDLRTGRSVLLLKGHVQGITACDWSPDGHTCATGAGDHSTRVWDMRQSGRCVAILPAHGGTITAVKFEPTCGGVLLTASHDTTVKLWGAPSWGLARAMRTGEAKVMGADLGPGASLVATASYDRTVKVWATQEGGDAAMAEA